MKAQSTTTTPLSSLLRSSLWSTPSPIPSSPPTSPPTKTIATTTTTTKTTEPKPKPDSPPPPPPPLSSYVILLEHSISFPKRLLAAEPSSFSSRSTEEHRRAGLVPPNETAKKDLVGGVGLIQVVEQELGVLCHGRVVRVRCLGRNGSGDGDDGGGGNGVIVDLASDPLGWDDDDKEEEEEGTTPNDKNEQKNQRNTVIIGRINTLSSIFHSIQRAIEILRTTDSSSSSSSSSSPGNPSFHKSIPVIFDSIAPILLYHSVPRFLLLLQQLKRNLRDTAVSSIDSDGGSSSSSSSSSPKAASPLILPLPTETIPPYDLRLLEDASDAVLSVEGGVASIARRSGREGGMYSVQLGCGGKRLMREVQEFEIGNEDDDDDGGGGAVVRLVHGGAHTTRNREEGGRKGVDGDDGDRQSREMGSTKSGAVVKDGDGNNKVVTADHSQSVGTVPMNERNYGSGFGRRTITLRHEEEDDREKKVAKPTLAMAIGNSNEEHGKKVGGVSKPRIYLEDNDPEFDDLDEEDPDDDLDI